MRDKSQGCYEPAEKKIFEVLLPHIQRAFGKRSIKGMRRKEEIQWELLKHCPFGVLIFGSENKVIFANDLAEKIISSNDGLVSTRSGFGAASYGENRRLKQIIKETVHASFQRSRSMHGGNILISRPSGKRHYSLQVTPILEKFATKKPCPAATVFIHDIERQSNLPIEQMKKLYGLTTTEARVASKITQGKSLELCAQELGHAVPTSRNFAKTGTGRQNELANLLLSSPMAILPVQHTVSVPLNKE